MLDQGKDGACVTFWFAGASMYNTDLVFTSEDAYKMAKEANGLDGAMAWQIGQLFAKAYNLSLVTFEKPTAPDAQRVLDLGYALWVSTRFPLKFFADGIVDGKVDKEYEQNIKNTPTENKIMLHFMYLIKENGKYYFVNSWADYMKKNLFNKYEVDMELLIKKNLLTRECFLIA